MEFKKSNITLRLILGDQLNSNHSWFNKVNPNVIYVMMEVMPEQVYVAHHIQKTVAFFNAMRHFSKSLSDAGHQVKYFKINDTENRQSFFENLKFLCDSNVVSKFEYQLPDEYRLDDELKKTVTLLDLEYEVFDTEHFLTTRNELETFFKGKKQLLMESFYRYMRKKTNILMNGNDPEGGQWNFDHENRKSYDGKVPLRPALKFSHEIDEIVSAIKEMQIKTIGNINASDFSWPANRKEALLQLDWFCKELLPAFGTYEDAMLTEHTTLFHSRLSFALNTKMLHPEEVIRKVIVHKNKNPDSISISQVEGFIRQIIGWREYMRGIYWMQMPQYAKTNFFAHNQNIPDWYWTGKTSMNCMKQCISNSLENAYAHHIQRLMVIGNFSLLAGIHPDQVDQWYLGVYADAIEWVEITNTRGMSQYADGGLVASKPYVASANYISKMSNYCKTCLYNKNSRTDSNSCPFNALYWNFFIKNQNKLQSNPRIGMVYMNIKKMSVPETEAIKKRALWLTNNLETL